MFRTLGLQQPYVYRQLAFGERNFQSLSISLGKENIDVEAPDVTEDNQQIQQLQEEAKQISSTDLGEEIGGYGFDVKVPSGVYPLGVNPPPSYIRTPQVHLVQKFLSWQNMSTKHKWSRRMRQVISEFQMNISDYKSLPLKAAMSHTKMQQLKVHRAKNLQDKKSKVKLRETWHKRMGALKRLRELNYEVYYSTIKKLGLEDDWARMTFGMRYKPGVTIKYSGGIDPYAEDISDPEPTTPPKRKIKGKFDYKNVKLIRGIDY
eukprot:TRINITY_DN4693_c0_g2_i1.p2 TRINITY_DN4693_c0_g2~~TRINITY_DN4693_c0_g2_i1.p2  ORF type:complete len:277 (-),score=24.63 TRINITY_DN4693_c0_g2_i1:876-1661(-)